jgi:RNA polymerase sigma factor (sigma-70 family)
LTPYHPPSSEEIDLDRLCVAIQSGCSTSEEVLCNFLSPSLKLVLRRRAPEHYMDAVQETLLVVLKAVREGKVRQPASLVGFARMTGLNIVNKSIRRNRFVAFHEYSAKADVSIDFGREGDRQSLDEALRQLTESDQELIDRFYLREEPLSKIALDLGLTLRTVQIRKSRALGRLRELVWRTKRMAELRRLAKPLISKVKVNCVNFTINYA